ncbi:probable calcium-binding protein CML41 [Telopea speciosissima]|uniref:probable calcium-binding protein CML41 n=1 Tax=Telopea speciosissima TaxID=54955 RepID=UPI001CC3A4DE|nr:probable calcium-binding protein CML41 [Telopea speciosissima]XP_043692486.1 probable calcium-binding protein CML41 [Telopea speciosissima]
MATAVVSKATLSKWFSNKSFVLSVHRLQHSKKQSRNDELQQIFRHLDADGNGKILGSELRSYFASKREFMSPEEAQGVINELDAAGGDSLMLSFDDFAMLMEREGGDDDLKRGFQMFVAKSSGSITPDGLQRIFSRLGNKMSNEECKSIIQAFDRNGDGVIDFAEFQQMMA